MKSNVIDKLAYVIDTIIPYPGIQTFITLDNKLNKDIFEKAFRKTLEYHPSLKMKISVDENKKYFYFTGQADLNNIIEYIPVKSEKEIEDLKLKFISEKMVKEKPFIKFKILEYKDKHIILYGFSHIATDATGGMIFYNDLVNTYNAIKNGDDYQRPVSNVRKIDLIKKQKMLLKFFWLGRFLKRHVFKLPGKKKKSVNSESKEGKNDESQIEYGFKTLELDKGAVKVMKKKCRKWGVGRNEILCAAMLKVLRKKYSDKKKYSIVMPINLRTLDNKIKTFSGNFSENIAITLSIDENDDVEQISKKFAKALSHYIKYKIVLLALFLRKMLCKKFTLKQYRDFMLKKMSEPSDLAAQTFTGLIPLDALKNFEGTKHISAYSLTSTSISGFSYRGKIYITFPELVVDGKNSREDIDNEIISELKRLVSDG